MSAPPMATESAMRRVTMTAGRMRIRARMGRPVGLVSKVTNAWMMGGVTIDRTMKMQTRRYSPLRKLLKKVL